MNIFNIKREIEDIIKLLQQQKVQNAYEQFFTTINTLLSYIGKIEMKEEKTNTIINLNKTLLQCTEAMEVKDTILLSDLLEYEVLDLLDEIFGE